MKEIILKRVLNAFGISALAVLLLTCNNGFQVHDQHGKALVSFSVADARTVLPQVSLADVASYQLLGGINGEAEATLVESFTGTGTSLPLNPGMWNFTLNAYNSDDEHILQGIVQDKQINLAGANTVTFSLSSMNTGTGTIQITFNFPESAGITQISTNGDIDSEDFPPDDSESFVYIQEEVASGDYFISFEFYSDDILRAVVPEWVIVRNNLISSKTITLVGNDLKPLLTGTVSISGTAEVGETLTADTSALDRIGDIAYQWNRVGTGGSATAIPDANSNVYTVQSSDIGNAITVTVTRSGYPGSVTSDTTATVLPVLSGTVSISGTAWVGETLTADTDSLDGSGDISYQWKRGTADIGVNTDTYVVQSADVGYTITVTVTRSGYSGSVTSDPTDAVLPILSGTVSIDGNPWVGKILTADTSDLDGSGDISYQWNRGGTAILNANSGTYAVQTADVSSTITVTVRRTGYSGSVTSAAVGPILNSGTTTLSITFSQIADLAPPITGPTLYRISNGGPTESTITVDEPEQYDSISWRVQNTTVTGTGESFILSAANTAYNLIGEHFVTVLVMKSGVPYSKTVSFKVEY